MQKSIFRKNLDMQSPGIQWSIDVKKIDTDTRRIVFTLYDKGVHFDVGDSCEAVIFAVKPDGKTLYNSCTVENGKCIYDITTQTVAAVGIVDCELRITDAGQLITSPRFQINVCDIIDSEDAVESSNEFTYLVNKSQEANEKINECDIAINACNETANSIRRQAENGEFNGAKGEKGDKGDKGDIGEQGPQGIQGEKGDSYVLTDSDKQEIAGIVNDTVVNELETMIDESGVLV